MARALRIDIPDGVYHVMSRGLDRRAIVRDDQDRQTWTELLGRTAERRHWSVFAWALLDNHFHVFLRTPHADLSAGMHDLNAGYVTRFNWRHRRSGPLLQGRFRGVLVEEGHHYWELSRYIHLNPVRAGLVPAPEAYAWGSCRFYFRSRSAPSWLAWEEILGEHGWTLRTARRRYREFLQEGISLPPQSPFGDTVASTLLGSSGFVNRMKVWLHDRLPDADVPAARELRHEVSVEQVEAAVCKAYGVSPECVRARGKHHNEARCVGVYLCRRLTGMRLADIGKHFGGVRDSSICNTVAQLEHRRRREKGFGRMLTSLEERLARR